MDTLEAGPAEAPTVVLLHGGGLAGWMWRPQIEALQEFHLLVPDLPEHGGSASEGPFTFADAAGRVATLIQTRAHGERAHVVGLSLGGQLAVQLLASYPQCLQRVLVSGTLVRPLPLLALARRPWARALTRAMLMAYRPWRNANWLVHANMRANSIPPELDPEFRTATRELDVDRLLRLVLDVN